MWVRIKNKPGSPYAGLYSHGHRSCLENFNELICCGFDRHTCRSPLCCFAGNYDHGAACAAYEARKVVG